MLWPAPTSSCWAPASSAPRSRCISPSGACASCSSTAALAEHEALIAEAGASRYLRKNGWLKVYRSEETLAATARERELATKFAVPHEVLDRDGTLAREPALAPVFCGAVHWPAAASISNPLALTGAYAARFAALGGAVMTGDAHSLRRAGGAWQV